MPCRLCTANDREALVEEIAAEVWESTRHGTIDDRAWVDAGTHWQGVFRRHADCAMTVM